VGDRNTHLVLIPSYNTGTKLLGTVDEALQHWQRVWVVLDGSTDGSGEALLKQNRQDERLRVHRRAANGGKGAAVLEGLHAAVAEGFTHVLVMDADGQHPAAMIPDFMALSRDNPEAMILGLPIFDREAPRVRVIGRRVSNRLAKFETGGAIGDSLFGFRVYPIAPLIAVMEGSRWMRRFDFDAEVAVRLSWRGVRAINTPAPVRYFRREEGGVSHFRYGRDNALLTAMHARLMMTRLLRRVRSFRR
jgi:glycosyltransferase involved in cell wall biosynthesis